MILVAVAQLARASPCEGECCGFKSRQSPQKNSRLLQKFESTCLGAFFESKNK